MPEKSQSTPFVICAKTITAILIGERYRCTRKRMTAAIHDITTPGIDARLQIITSANMISILETGSDF